MTELYAAADRVLIPLRLAHGLTPKARARLLAALDAIDEEWATSCWRWSDKRPRD